jgi:2-phosphosulfolactate phosphatase
MTAYCEWGLSGIEALHRDVRVLVIVDVLSFSTAVDVAVSRGAPVYPFPFDDLRGAYAAAALHNAILAQPRQATGAGFTLSPASLAAIPRGTRLMLPSPNGSRLSFAAARTPGRVTVLAGCLRNATAVARTARVLADGGSIGVIPAGEAWPDGSLRPAIEDMLGAGAIVDRLSDSCSPEAQVMKDAYRSAGRELAGLIRMSVSGRELVDRGFPGDIDMAVDEDVSTSVPVMVDGMFQAIRSAPVS